MTSWLRMGSFCWAHHGRFLISVWRWKQSQQPKHYCVFSENGTKENVRYVYQLKIFPYYMDPINISCLISLQSSQTLAGKLIHINCMRWTQSPSASVRRRISVRVDVTVNECTVLRQECRVVGSRDYVKEVMYATKSVLHMGLPYFQKSATLHRCRGNIIWSCVFINYKHLSYLPCGFFFFFLLFGGAML
jgi:hypothetical protein